MAYRNQKIEQLEQQAQTFYRLRLLRFVFYFYSFMSFVFWFLNCLEVDLYRFNFLFIVPYRIVNVFYHPQGVSVDFSLAIIGIISFLLGLSLDIGGNSLIEKIYNKIEQEEHKLAKRKQDRKQTTSPISPNPVYVEDVINERTVQTVQQVSQIQQVQPVLIENTLEEFKLLFIIQPRINKIKRNENDLELTFQEVDVWKQRVNKKLILNVSYSKPMQKGYYRKNLFLMYRDFNYVDDFVYYIKPTIDSIVLEFRKYGVNVSFSYVLSSLSRLENLEKELDCMDTILSLDFINEYIATHRFKLAYDNRPIKRYTLKMKGEYNLSKNLSISNRQPIYALVSNAQEGVK